AARLLLVGRIRRFRSGRQQLGSYSTPIMAILALSIRWPGISKGNSSFRVAMIQLCRYGAWNKSQDVVADLCRILRCVPAMLATVLFPSSCVPGGIHSGHPLEIVGSFCLQTTLLIFLHQVLDRYICFGYTSIKHLVDTLERIRHRL